MKIARWAVTICYAAGIFYLSSRAWSGTPSIPYLDKIVHFFLYAGLGYLCAWSLGDWVEDRGAKVLIAAVLIATAYGALDEIHQMYVAGRSAEWADLASDAIGSITGVLLAAFLRRRCAEAGRGNAASTRRCGI